MRLWTIQALPAWERLERDGVLSGDPTLIWPRFISAYDWMCAQMRRRIGPPPRPDQLPIWAWARWSAAHIRPDLRATAHLPPGTAGVRIEIEVDPARVLRSDFHLWHHVLNYWYLSTSEADDEAVQAALTAERLDPYRQKPLAHPGWHARILASWERIFTLEDQRDGWTGNSDSIQAVLWELRRADVRRAQRFVAR